MEIRLATSADAARIAEIYRPIVVSTPASFEVEPPDDREISRRLEATWPALPWLVCEELVYEQGQRVVGYAYAGQHRVRAAYQWSVDSSVYVDSAFHRRGIARSLYESLFKILVAQGYFNAYAGITLPNPASVGLHESLGFQPVGVYRNVGYKLGQWHDVGWWQRPLRQPADIPHPLLRLDELQMDASWPRLLASGLAHSRG
jgi:L-amino acid N-acyltransferase YncA